MNLRTLSSASFALFNLVLLVGIILAMLYLSERHYTRIDLTSNKAYTLSDSTREILKNLQDILHIKVYMSKDLPPEFASPSRDIRDTLDEFAAIAGRMIDLRFIDPTDDEALKAELNQMGILELRAQIRNKERLESKNIFFSAAFFYRNRKEVIRNLYEISDVELSSVQAIVKLVSERAPKIAYVTSNKTFSLDEEISYLYKSLLTTFNVAKVDLEKGEDIPKDTDILFIAGASEKFSSYSLFQIDQYLMKGGKLVLFVDRVRLETTNMGASIKQIDTDLEKLLEHYGIKVNQDMVCDHVKKGPLRYNYAGQILIAPYPAFVGIDKTSFEKHPSPITSGLQILYFPWISSMDFDTQKLAANTVSHLAVSSESSTVQTSNYNIDPQRMAAIGEKKERIIASLVTGKFTSYFKDKPKPPPPPDVKPPGEKPEGAGENPDSEAETIPESLEEGFIAITSGSNFATDAGLGMFGQNSNNLQFSQNVFEYLALGKVLLGIRMKKVTMQKVIEGKLNKSKTMLWILNLALMPLIIFLAGLMFKIFSFLRKKRYENMVGR